MHGSLVKKMGGSSQMVLNEHIWRTIMQSYGDRQPAQRFFKGTSFYMMERNSQLFSDTYKDYAPVHVLIGWVYCCV
ncbi:hypothetical protein [Peribacillus sp. SCS-155]|uniref:hypothetical protein n=1 Tax=Peribacillus sedimenti TaxID=3115297 RepID=UPI003905890D